MSRKTRRLPHLFAQHLRTVATVVLLGLPGFCAGFDSQRQGTNERLQEVSATLHESGAEEGWARFLPIPDTHTGENQQHRNVDNFVTNPHDPGKNSLLIDLHPDQASEPWHSWNSSDLVPVIPKAISWLVYEAEQEYLNRTSSTGFDVKQAQQIARYTSVAYCSPEVIEAWNGTRCKNAGELEVYRAVFDPVWDLQAYAGYSKTLQAKIIVFRGTDSRSIYNWVENMHYWRTDLSVPFPNATGALVHTGFYVSYAMSSLHGNLTEAMVEMQKDHPNTPLYVAGHSLGSAMATICALDMKYNFNESDVRVYTFGSPRVGNLAFAKYFESSVQESWRITHNRDLVPSVPLGIMGFMHVSREVWQVDYEGHGVLAVCDTSGEDARCHNSMCYLGLCTSLADHLSYIGSAMHRDDDC